MTPGDKKKDISNNPSSNYFRTGKNNVIKSYIIIGQTTLDPGYPSEGQSLN